ncbi:hypothetical protein EV121DRAFT_274900 [Schizophyllum commune]
MGPANGPIPFSGRLSILAVTVGIVEGGQAARPSACASCQSIYVPRQSLTCTIPGLRRFFLFHCVKALGRDDRCPFSPGCRESVAFSGSRTAAVCPAPVEGAYDQGEIRTRIEAREDDIKEASRIAGLAA